MVARAPAWVDEDEEELAVSIAGVSRRRKLRKDTSETEIDGQEFSQRLREKYKQLNAKTGWADLSTRKAKDGSDSDSDSDDEGARTKSKGKKFSKDKLLRKTGSLLSQSSVLPAQIMEATRVKDGNYAETSSCVVQAVEFHPKSLLMLTAGFDKMLRLYDIDGVHNPKVRSAFFEGMPIRKAKFLNDYSVLCAGRRPFCYKFNIETGGIEKIGAHVTGFEKGSSLENFAISSELGCVSFLGRNGNIALVSSKSNQKIAEFKVDSRASCASFVADSKQFVAATSHGEVSRWDLRMYRCIERYFDQGNLNATALDISSRGTCAIGSDSGVVNIYQNSSTTAAAPSGMGTVASKRPTKSIMNLTTKVDFLKFNPSGNILAMSSSMKRDSLRLVHVPTQTVFQNWPTSKTPLHYVHCSAFSPGSGYFAVGNARGRVLLYRLQHFDAK
jgi:U3 small nucleolar RNA-associated protein 18